jgi:ankyrin repeat protein
MNYFADLGVDVNSKDKIHQTPLYYAAREGKFLCCKFLIERSCPLNEKDLYHQTPLYYSAR